MQSVEPVLENAIKTLQKVVDVRGMGKSSLVMTAPAEIYDGPVTANQLLMESIMQGDDAKKEEAKKEEEKKDADAKKEAGKSEEEKKEDKADKEKADKLAGKMKKKCEWVPPALEAEIKKAKKDGLNPKEKADAEAKEAGDAKKEEEKKDAKADKAEEKKEEAKAPASLA